jgi:hypothetical protein
VSTESLSDSRCTVVLANWTLPLHAFEAPEDLMSEYPTFLTTSYLILGYTKLD